MQMSVNIQHVMQERGVNASQLAKDANLNPTGIYDIISGKSRNPRLDTLHKIAKALEVSVASLLEEKDINELRHQLSDVLSLLPKEEQDRLLLTAKAWLRA